MPQPHANKKIRFKFMLSLLALAVALPLSAGVDFKVINDIVKDAKDIDWENVISEARENVRFTANAEQADGVTCNYDYIVYVKQKAQPKSNDGVVDENETEVVKYQLKQKCFATIAVKAMYDRGDYEAFWSQCVAFKEKERENNGVNGGTKPATLDEALNVKSSTDIGIEMDLDRGLGGVRF